MDSNSGRAYLTSPKRYGKSLCMESVYIGPETLGLAFGLRFWHRRWIFFVRTSNAMQSQVL